LLVRSFVPSFLPSFSVATVMLFLVSGDVSNAFLLLLAVVGRRHKKKEKVTRGGTVKIDSIHAVHDGAN
jgi:hypothetical protein